MTLTNEQNALINSWNSSKRLLSTLKEDEAKLRAQVGLTVFANASYGANTIELGGGYRCTYTRKMNYGLVVPQDAPEGTNIQSAMETMAEEMRRASNEGSFVFPRLVKWKPELSVSEYKKLSPELKRVVDKYVLASEGAPTLELKEPAAKKGE